MSRFRRVLLVLYLADVAVLAWLVPHRSAVRFNVGDWHSQLLGFSPDGTLLATATRSPLDAEEYDVRLWDFAGRPAFGSPRLVAERHFDRLAHLGWNWPDDPGRRWLFWQCALADDPQVRADELYPGVTLDAEKLDPTENPPRFRASPDGRYYLLRVAGRRLEVRGREGGRVLWVTSPLTTPPVFGPGPEALTVLEPVGKDDHATVVRYDLLSGRETERTTVQMPQVGNRPVRNSRLSPDGRHLGSVDWVEKDTVAVVDVATGRHLAAGGQFLAGRWIDPPGRLVAIHLDGRRETKAQFWALGREAPLAEVDPPFGHFDFENPFAAVSPDGSAVVLHARSRPGAVSSGWPVWLRRLYYRVVGNVHWGSSSLAVHTTADGRALGAVTLAHSGGGNRITGEGVAAFSPDGRWLAVIGGELTLRAGVAMSGDAVVSVYEYPFRRPWPWILACSAAPPLGLALLVAGVRRLRRGRVEPGGRPAA